MTISHRPLVTYVSLGTMRTRRFRLLLLAATSMIAGCTDYFQPRDETGIVAKIVDGGNSLPAFSALLQPQRGAMLGLSSQNVVSLDVASSSSPSNADGSPNSDVPTSLNLSTDLSRDLIPAPPDAPNHPPTANYKASMWADYVANYKKYKVSVDLTENQGGAAQGHAENENLGEFTVPNAFSAWMGPAPTGVYRNYDADYAEITGAMGCGVTAIGTADYTVSWRVPDPVPGAWSGFVFGGTHKNLSRVIRYDVCSDGDGSGGPSGGGGGSGSIMVYTVTYCWGYDLYDQYGNHILRVIEGCSTYQL
jgi:hypothetical protein